MSEDVEEEEEEIPTAAEWGSGNWGRCNNTYRSCFGVSRDRQGCRCIPCVFPVWGSGKVSKQCFKCPIRGDIVGACGKLNLII